VNSDAHSARNLELLRFGIATARRAWLTAEQVANTRPRAEFAPLRKRARA
jgi:DNA polymerase (family 10)